MQSEVWLLASDSLNAWKKEMLSESNEKEDKMSQYEKIMFAILSGAKDKNILFSDLQTVLDRLGFQCRVKGDHFIYTKENIDEIIHIQSNGKMAKLYQVRKVCQIILKYQIGGVLDEV